DQKDCKLSNWFTKLGYPLGIMVNALPGCFVNEGADFCKYRYTVAYSKSQAAHIADNRQTACLVSTRREPQGDGIMMKMRAESTERVARNLVLLDLEDFEEFKRELGGCDAVMHVFADSCSECKHERNPVVKVFCTEGPSLIELWEEVSLLMRAIGRSITFTFGDLMIDLKTTSVLEDETNKPTQY
ncbi:hypothetical protein V8E53_012676, partial [Lactarius tabidus]